MVEPKRELLMDAALKLFSRHGYRRTSVDDIAREADVSKGTVYVYFKDKETLFHAIVENFGEQLQRRSLAALALQGTPAEKMQALLEAKFLLTFDVLKSAPHAQELIDTSNLLAHDVVEKFASAYQGRVEKFIQQQLIPACPHLAEVGSARDVTQVILAAGESLCRQSDTEKQLVKFLSIQVRMLLSRER